MLKDRKYQGGQAITEMVIGLVAIAVVFTGLLFIGVVGTDYIEILMTARGEADENAYNGLVADSGQPLLEWNYGSDGLAFTPDDTPDGVLAGDAAYFTSQLVSSDTTYDLGSDTESYVQENFASSMPEGLLFLYAADLTSSSQSIETFLHRFSSSRAIGDTGETERSIANDVLGALMSLGIISSTSLTLSETVYMPRVTE